MQLEELVSYAKEKYGVEEQHKWTDFPGFSVLCHPQTGKWAALLMRQWDGETGRELQSCDLKCGGDSLYREPSPCLSPPLRMRGGKWINVTFDERTDCEQVYRLFDRAIRINTPQGFTIVLDAQREDESAWRDTPLPFAGSGYRAEKEALPDRLRQMRRLVDYSGDSRAALAKNFVRQAEFMRDYEDDVPWEGDFVSYYPSYADLNTRQLRGYFTWRARLRRGEFQPVPASAAYLYVYELLNGVGAEGPEACYIKLREFERGYLDSGCGDERMRANLHRWMLEFAVLKDLPPELARQAADPDAEARDEALAVLRDPDGCEDEAVFAALCALGGKKLADSPVLAADGESGRALFARAWRAACAYRWQERELFRLCFGEKKTRLWYPLSNAVYYERSRPQNRDYELNACRSYHCCGGVWQTESYERQSFDRARLQGFLRETDARLRRYLKTGRYLKENPADEWALPYIDAVIEADRRARLEAARPKISIDLSGLEQIRRDAALTRESLLTEEEIEPEEERAEPAAAEPGGDLPLDALQLRVLRALLAGEDPAALIRDGRRMPSILADEINETLFDKIGDTVLLCEDDRLLLVDDYVDDLKELLGGKRDG